MKKIRYHLNKYKKASYLVSFFLLFFSALLIYIDYNNAQKIYDSIQTVDLEELVIKIDKQIEQAKLEYIQNLDYTNNSSLTKFVNNKVSFDWLDYVPEDLVSISSDYVYDTKWYSTLRKQVNDSLQELAEDFKQEFWKKLTVVSAYRSYDYQKGIKDRGCPDNLCAKAWYSEHQSWLAVDIFAATTQEDWQSNSAYMQYFEWFKENAYKYWFHNSYQNGVEIDWYEIEPWHWRYLWNELALYLRKNEITFAEFWKGMKG